MRRTTISWDRALSEAATQVPNATGWQTFGHDAAVRMLDASNVAGRLSHAYLITGPEQTGRRTLAIDIACLVNCEPRPDMFGEAAVLDLESCPAAQRIRKGHHADIRVITAATPLKADKVGADGDSDSSSRQRISINHIHDLQHDAALKPFEGKARVFIIDGAEGLSAEAANALLKTLEEPSEGVYIVLVATSAESLPDTIVSRCQRISLRPVNQQLIAEHLVDHFGLELVAAERLAKLSGGRAGWAITAVSDPAVLELYTQAALRILNAVSADLEGRFVYARELSGRFWRDRDAVLSELHRWLEWWRDAAIAKAGLRDSVINADWLAAFDEIGGQLTEGAIAQAANSVSRTITALEANAIPRLALEVMMLDMPPVTLSDRSMATADAGPAGN